MIKCRQIKTGRKRKKIKTFMFDDECCHIRRQIHYLKNPKECYAHNREIREKII